MSDAPQNNDQIPMETQPQEPSEAPSLFKSMRDSLPSDFDCHQQQFTSCPPAAAGALVNPAIVSPVAEGGVGLGSDTENQEPQLPLPKFQPRRPLPSGTTSDCPSESSAANIDTEDDFPSTFQHLEKFYERLTEKERLPRRQGSADWVISLARSHRRLSKEKRLRGHLRGALGNASLSSTAASSRPSGSFECSFDRGGSSNTDDSGYEGGYETDADESEMSEWEVSTASPRLLMQRHKRKLDVLANQLTMRLRVSQDADSAGDGGEDLPFPAQKVQKGTVPIGVKLSLGTMPKPVPPVPLAFSASTTASSDMQRPFQKPVSAAYAMPPQFTPQRSHSWSEFQRPLQNSAIMEVEPTVLHTLRPAAETVQASENNYMDTS